MRWRFTILDRDSVTHVIDEPVGWDNNKVEISRDQETHGIFFSFQGETFEFYDEAYRLIKAEYDSYKQQGVMTLILEEDCGDGYEEFSRGKFVFLKYKHFEADVSYIKIPVETDKEVMDLRNRINQKVNLESNTAFDEVTALTPYDKLPFDMELPSKGIFIQDHALAETDIEESFNGGLQAPFNTGWNLTVGQLELAMTTKASEIGGFSFNPVRQVGPTYFGHTFDLSSQNSNPVLIADTGAGTLPLPGIWPLNLSPTVNFYEGSPNYNDVRNPVQLGMLINGTIHVLNCVLKTTAVYILRLPDRPNLLTNGELLSHYEIIYRKILYNPGSGTAGVGLQPGATLNIGASFVDDEFILNKGDRLYFFIATQERKTQGMIDAINAGAKAFRLVLDDASFFKITNLSRTKTTVSKVFAINEVISRVVESITNLKLKGYSEYFGRTDSEPYSHGSDGCGSLAVVLDGIRIRRQENKVPGKTNIFSLSLQDLWDGLNPMHNLGYGIEADPARPGYNRFRMEPWYHFYNTDVIMSCTGVNKITREVHDKDIYSTFQFGYQKWEAEEYTGLDEFLTKRNYRTALSQVKNDLIKLCKWILSGYALEVTRRKGNEDSKDWRYDKDTFMVCATRIRMFHAVFNAESNTMVIDYSGDPTPFSVGSITIAGSVSNNGTRVIFAVSFTAETVTFQFLGGATITEEAFTVTFPGIVFAANLYAEIGNVTNPENIIDPGTLYNYRRSPVRNAMRWMNKILASYTNFDSDSKILFTDGDGNYFAEGQMTSATCRLESGVIAENQTIDPDTFLDEEDARPLLLPERVLYEYPMNSREFKAIEANPYGLIYFEGNCEEGYGHIETITYKPEEGLAVFNLIPRDYTPPPAPGVAQYLITENEIPILTEDEENIEVEI